MPLDTRPELAVVRQVMQRLLTLWDTGDPPVTPDEARRLATVICLCARTVAHLLGRAPQSESETQAWIAAALDALNDEVTLQL